MMSAMLRTASRSSLVRGPAFRATPLASSIINTCHVPITSKREKSASAEAPGVLMPRIILSTEVTISKIFPAGFGWQGASCVAAGMGFEATDMGFFALTGLGDFTGVFLGHTGYYLAKSMVSKGINMGEQATAGLWLGSAAFCSGFAWQPLVNFFTGTCSMQFDGTATGVLGGCGVAFYVGLRLFRALFSSMGMPMPKPDYANLKADAWLSLSIGGATAVFVGTDPSLAGNVFASLVGVTDTMSDLEGMCRAGLSTAIGFNILQQVQNFLQPAGKNWQDPGAFA